MRFDDLTCEDEAQSGARDPQLPADVAPKELREDLLLVSSGNPEPFVPHPDPRLVPDQSGGDLLNQPRRDGGRCLVKTGAVDPCEAGQLAAWLQGLSRWV